MFSFNMSQLYPTFDDFKSRMHGYASDLPEFNLSDLSLKIAYFILKTTFWHRESAYMDVSDFEGALLSILNDIMDSYATRYNALSYAYNLPAVNFFGYSSKSISDGSSKMSNSSDGTYSEEAIDWVNSETNASNTVTNSGVNSYENDIKSLENLIDRGWKGIKKELAVLFKSYLGYYVD